MKLLGKALVAFGSSAAIALSAPAASAVETFHIVSPGFLWGVTKQRNDAPVWGAIGGELTYAYLYPRLEPPVSFGAFGQVQSVGFHHLRAAVGPQATIWCVGLELGPYIETQKDIYATTIGLHVSPFFTLGFISAAFRAGVPIATTSEGTRYGMDLGVVFTLKLPFAPAEKKGYVPLVWTFFKPGAGG